MFSFCTSDLKNSHILTLITRWRIRNGGWLNLSIEQEAEGAKSFDNGYYSAFYDVYLNGEKVYLYHEYYQYTYKSKTSKEVTKVVGTIEWKAVK